MTEQNQTTLETGSEQSLAAFMPAGCIQHGSPAAVGVESIANVLRDMAAEMTRFYLDAKDNADFLKSEGHEAAAEVLAKLGTYQADVATRLANHAAALSVLVAEPETAGGASAPDAGGLLKRLASQLHAVIDHVENGLNDAQFVGNHAHEALSICTELSGLNSSGRTEPGTTAVTPNGRNGLRCEVAHWGRKYVVEVEAKDADDLAAHWMDSAAVVADLLPYFGRADFSDVEREHASGAVSELINQAQAVLSAVNAARRAP